MANEAFSIPRHGAAGVAFLGVELKDTVILIASVFIGIAVGAIAGFGGYIGVPVLGYFANKAYIDWKSARLPGYLRAFLFTQGLAGYSSAFNQLDTLYIGDAVVINPGSATMLDAITSAYSKVSDGT